MAALWSYEKEDPSPKSLLIDSVVDMLFWKFLIFLCETIFLILSMCEGFKGAGYLRHPNARVWFSDVFRNFAREGRNK